jgi:hypothetical protein
MFTLTNNYLNGLFKLFKFWINLYIQQGETWKDNLNLFDVKTFDFYVQFSFILKNETY